MHPYFRAALPYREGQFPAAEDAYRRAVSLPMFPRMSDRDVDDVCDAVGKVVRHHRR
jgi:dTDP-4-amino-4,6-dideoxygalactose transaminase